MCWSPASHEKQVEFPQPMIQTRMQRRGFKMLYTSFTHPANFWSMNATTTSNNQILLQTTLLAHHSPFLSWRCLASHWAIFPSSMYCNIAIQWQFFHQPKHSINLEMRAGVQYNYRLQVIGVGESEIFLIIKFQFAITKLCSKSFLVCVWVSIHRS